VKSAFAKEIWRSIRQSAGRFAAIAIISFLGAGFYGGLRMAAPDMRIAGDQFFDAGNLYDVRVVSTMGLDQGSLDILADIEGVQEVMATRSAAVMMQTPAGSYATVVESLAVDSAIESDTTDGVHARSDDGAYLNRPILVEGEWPTDASECVVSVYAAQKAGLGIGDMAIIEKGEQDVEDTFSVTRFTVVGLVNTSAYAAKNQYGTTSLGTGDVDLYVYVPDGAFDEDYPLTNAYLQVEGARDHAWGDTSYDETVERVRARAEQAAYQIALARHDTVVTDAQSELDDARAEYEQERAEAVAELTDAATELADAQAQLNDAAADIAAGKAQLDDSAAQLNDARQKLVEGEKEYADGVAQLATQRADAQAGFDAAQAQIDEQRATMAEGVAQLDTLKAQRDALAQLPELTPEQQQMLATLEQTIAQIESGVAALDAAQVELDAQRTAAEAGFAEAEAQLAAARAELDAGWNQTNEGFAQYESGLRDYEQGVADYQSGVREYNDGVSEYADGVAEAERGFADAEAELADAQAEIDDIEVPEVFVLDRSKNPGAASLASDADGIAQIASLFPFMFFLVAALVSLTSMTRMVDEERQGIGTHKALGYSRGRITSKYLIYGVLASGLGSALGVVALGKLLPLFIMTAYQISYAIPVTPTPIDPLTAAKAIGLSVGVTALATWAAAAASLREKPAALMLPRVPKAGRRIVLERIKPLWSRMSFSHKVTARNLLRYRRRFFMAVVGVAGCTALLLIGFGLRDAIGGIVENQFERLINYDVVVRLDEDAESDAKADLDRLIAGDEVERALHVQDFAMIARAQGTDDQRIQVVVPHDPGQLGEFVTLRERVSQEPLVLGEGEIVLTEKAATVLGVSVGDTVQLYDSNEVGDATGDPHVFTVGGIAENYLGHYAYMEPATYEHATGEAPEFTTLYLVLSDNPDKLGLEERLRDTGAVNTVSFVADRIVSYEDMLDVMNKLILVIVLAAAALAFVVLYNLTNINIGERIREIATLKVLGFTKPEVHVYIFREVFVMSFIGAIVGCLIGMPLTTYIAQAAETPLMMFGRTIEPLSFVYAFALTLVFTAIVAVSMRGKLARVDMVASLKSVE